MVSGFLSCDFRVTLYDFNVSADDSLQLWKLGDLLYKVYLRYIAIAI